MKPAIVLAKVHLGEEQKHYMEHKAQLKEIFPNELYAVDRIKAK
jgi:hypothetical protein